MPIYGASITKRFLYHGVQEEFSNVYHYNSGVIDSVAANAILDQLVQLERPVHASGPVFFVEGRVWEVGGSPQENEMILVRDLSGQGSLAIATPVHRACAVVVKLYLGRKSRTGRRVYLRKHVHSAGLPSSAVEEAVGAAVLGATNKGPFLTYGNGIKNLTVAGVPDGARLCAPDGSGLPLGTNAEVLDYLSIRQFGR